MQNSHAQIRAEFVTTLAMTMHTRMNHARNTRMLSLVLLAFPYLFAIVLLPLHVYGVLSLSAMLMVSYFMAAFGLYQYIKIAIFDMIETMACIDIVLSQNASMKRAIRVTQKSQSEWADVDALYA